MSSTPQRQGLLKKQSLLKGVINFRSVQTRLFAASAFLLVAAFFSVNVLAVNPNQSILATGSANTQQAGFVASTISDLLSFFGLAEAAPAAMAPQVCVAPPQAADMTAWFTGNGVTTDIAPQDAVADVATLTGGAAYGAGRVGQGFSLNGTTAYVAVTSSADTNVSATGGGDISMDAWINPGTTAGTGQPIAEYGNPTDTGVHFWHSVPGFGDAGSLFINVVDQAGVNHVFHSAVIPGFTAGTLQHVAFTFDNATDTATFYHNGTAFPNVYAGPQQNLPVPATIETTAAYNLNLGARIDATAGTAFFSGIIDEFELFDEVLTPASVTAIYNAGLTGEGKCSGAFDFTTATQTTPEGNVAIIVTVTRSGDLTAPATVDVATANLTALSVDGTGCAAGNDYQGFSIANPITLNFLANDPTESLSVQICDDAVVEPDETFTLNLVNPTGPSSVGTTTPVQTVTITDGADTPVSVTVAPTSVTEDGVGNLIYTFSRGSAGAGAITVNFSIGGTATAPPAAGADYACSAGTGASAATCVGAAGTVTFNAGATTAQVVVDPTADTDATETDETVIFTVIAGAGYSVGAPASATGTIGGDDTDVSVTVAPASVTENGPGTLVYTFTRSGTLTAGQVVTFSVGGTACSLAPCTDNFPPDYTQTGATTFTGTNGTVAGSGTVTFVGAATTATVTVDPTGDSNIEPAETVIFTVTATPGVNASPTAAEGTITNDDTTYTIAATPPTANEGNANIVPNPQPGGTLAGSFAIFTVTRTGDLSTTGTVDVATVPTLLPLPANTETATAGLQNSPCGTAGVDYIFDGDTLTFAPTVATQTFTVAVCGDTVFEQDEVFDAALSNPVNGTVGVPARATYTINDDDAFPILRISDGSATEGSPVVFTVTQVNAAGNPLVSGSATTFRFCTTDVTATHGVDYTGQPCPGGSAVFTIAAGETSTTITVPTLIETPALFEGAETFLVDLIDVTNATLVGGDSQGVGTISDGQAPNSFTIDDVAQAEGSTPAGTTFFNFTLTRSGPSQSNQVVCVSTMAGNIVLPGGGPNPATPGTAPGTPPGADYTEITSNPPNNCFTFTPGGPDSITVPVIVYQDTVFENDETFTVKIDSVTGGAAIPPANFSDTGLGTILNDDLAPTLRVRTVDALGNTITNQSESVTPYRFRVERIGQSQLPATFVFRTTDGSAPFTQPTGTGPATGGASPCGTPAVPTKDYLSNPQPPGTPTPAFFTIAGGVNTTDAFGANGFTDIPVTICNDAVRELDETFVGAISAPTGAVINAPNATTNPSAAQARINDDDGSPIITVSDVTMAEGNSGTTAFNFTITLTGSTTLPVVVTYSTVDGLATVADNDYQPIVAGTQTFAPGETSKTVTVLVNGDLNNEVDETFTLQVTSATNASLDPLQGADAVGLGTIINDDGPRTFAVDNVTQNEGNDPNTTIFRFRVTGTGTSAFTQTVNFTTGDGTATGGTACVTPGTGGVDYISQSGTLTFTPGGTNFQDILVVVCGDNIQETDETFTVTISSTVPGQVPPSGSVGTGTIVNDDASMVVFRVDNVTGQEGNDPNVPTNFVFRITKDGGTVLSSTVTFVLENGTATGGAACGPGVDFINTTSPTSPQTFTAAQTFREITIRVCGDTVAELNETFTLRLTSATNGTISPTNGTGVGTIVNDDGPLVAQGIEGDINRTAVGVCGPGDGVHTAADSAQFKLFISGLATPCTDSTGPNNEFQRTDVADEGSLGDGRLTAADQQQIDNYIAELDPDRAAGGPTAPIAPAPAEERGAKSDSDKSDDIGPETGGGREVRGVPVSGAPGTDVLYAVEFISQGDETVTTLSLQFNQAVVSINGTSGTNNNPDVTAGTGANPGTSRTVNATQVAQGRIGVLLDFQGPLAAGTRQVVVFRFRILPGAAAGVSPVTFVDQPIVRSTSNAAAQSLNAKYTASTITVTGTPPVGARTLTIGTVTAPNGGQAVVPVTLTNGAGDETAISGSVTFPVGANGLTINGTSGTNPAVVGGTGLPAGCTVTTNATQAATGSIGFLIACPTAIAAGTQQVLRLTFGVPSGTPVPRTLAVAWSDTPIARGVTNAAAQNLPVIYVNGAVNVDISTAANGTLSGRVTDANGSGLRNATITVTGVGLDQPIRVVTGSLGYYTVEGLEVGQTYLVSLRANKRYQFASTTRLVTLTDNAQDIDFTADPQ